MTKLTPPAGDDIRRTRADGEKSRERLLHAAMRLFAEQGFAKTSTREIALAAGTNIASISYYFGDKAGLYRAAFTEAPHHRDRKTFFSDPEAPLRPALRDFYASLMDPLKRGDIARLSLRLWYREVLEPTGIWHEEIDTGIRPAHAGLTIMLARRMGLAAPDLAMERLAFCLVGQAIQLMVTREVIDKVSPALLSSDEAIDTWIDRMVDYAEAMIAAEQARSTPCTPSKPLSRKKKA